MPDLSYEPKVYTMTEVLKDYLPNVVTSGMIVLAACGVILIIWAAIIRNTGCERCLKYFYKALIGVLCLGGGLLVYGRICGGWVC